MEKIIKYTNDVYEIIELSKKIDEKIKDHKYCYDIDENIKETINDVMDYYTKIYLNDEWREQMREKWRENKNEILKRVAFFMRPQHKKEIHRAAIFKKICIDELKQKNNGDLIP